MKMLLGNTPVKSLNVHHFDMDTNDATMFASDLQAGVTAYARGQKITGTGRCFEFANYGVMETNLPDYIPTQINVIEIASLDCPIKNLIALNNMRNVDFSVEQTIGIAVIDGVEYPITVKCNGNIMTLNCEKTITLQSFYGKDNYV